MKKLVFILFSALFLSSCTTIKYITVMDNANNVIYEGEGKLKIKKFDVESNTFNIIIKEEDGTVKTFFGSLSGIIEDTKAFNY